VKGQGEKEGKGCSGPTRGEFYSSQQTNDNLMTFNYNVQQTKMK